MAATMVEVMVVDLVEVEPSVVVAAAGAMA